MQAPQDDNPIGPASGTDEVSETPSPRIADLIDKIQESSNKLVRDGASRGDLKILARALQELRYAFKVFAPYRQVRKVTIFGSARTAPEKPSYRQAVLFGKMIAQHGWFVVTGAASGIMEAGLVGAGREQSMGLNIMLPFEQSANRVIAGDPKLVNMKYFFTRKLMFVKESHAICLLPGGFGTLDEGLEVLTLLQTGKRDMVPVVFLDQPGGDYWSEFDRFVRSQLSARGMIDPDDLSLYKRTDDVEEAVREILDFFRVYHSMRYVHHQLVLRLNEPLSDELLDGLNEHFSGILTRGRFTQRSALPQEDEPELLDLPRLVFQFNRHDFAQLRRLIDCINRGQIEDSVG